MTKENFIASIILLGYKPYSIAHAKGEFYINNKSKEFALLLFSSSKVSAFNKSYAIKITHTYKTMLKKLSGDSYD